MIHPDPTEPTMLPAALETQLSDTPSLHHLGSSANEDIWGRGVGFPVLLFKASALDEDAFMELSGSFDDARLRVL